MKDMNQITPSRGVASRSVPGKTLRSTTCRISGGKQLPAFTHTNHIAICFRKRRESSTKGLNVKRLSILRRCRRRPSLLSSPHAPARLRSRVLSSASAKSLWPKLDEEMQSPTQAVPCEGMFLPGNKGFSKRPPAASPPHGRSPSRPSRYELSAGQRQAGRLDHPSRGLGISARWTHPWPLNQRGYLKVSRDP